MIGNVNWLQSDFEDRCLRCWDVGDYSNTPPLCHLFVTSLSSLCHLSVTFTSPLCHLSVASLSPLCHLSSSSAAAVCYGLQRMTYPSVQNGTFAATLDDVMFTPWGHVHRVNLGLGCKVRLGCTGDPAYPAPTPSCQLTGCCGLTKILHCLRWQPV